MLELRDVSVSYAADGRKTSVVDKVSLSVPSRGTLGLVGESGSGKSTTARAIVGLVPIESGKIALDGKDVSKLDARRTPEFRKKVQMVFQDPYASLNPRMTVRQSVQDAVRLANNSQRSGEREEALRALELVGIARAAAERYPHQFSGGQRQRIAIARALAVRPQILVLDEVTSALDVSVQATILNLLRQLQTELGLSYLFISHDLSVVAVMSDEVAVMYVGQIVESSEASGLFAEASHPYTQALLRCVPRFSEARQPSPIHGAPADPAHPPSGCRFHPRCPIGPVVHPDRMDCVDVDPQPLRRERRHNASCHYAAARDGVVTAERA